MENQFGLLRHLAGLAPTGQSKALRCLVRTADGNRIPRGSQPLDRVFTVRERSPTDDEIEWHINFHVDGLGRGRSAHQQQAQAEKNEQLLFHITSSCGDGETHAGSALLVAVLLLSVSLGAASTYLNGFDKRCFT